MDLKTFDGFENICCWKYLLKIHDKMDLETFDDFGKICNKSKSRSVCKNPLTGGHYFGYIC